jgi:hypothetical protein
MKKDGTIRNNGPRDATGLASPSKIPISVDVFIKAPAVAPEKSAQIIAINMVFTEGKKTFFCAGFSISGSFAPHSLMAKMMAIKLKSKGTM